MRSGKLFLNPDLTVEALASAIEVTPKKVSQVINESFGQNFFDYVNTYRIREAERIMCEPQDAKLTLLIIIHGVAVTQKFHLQISLCKTNLDSLKGFRNGRLSSTYSSLKGLSNRYLFLPKVAFIILSCNMVE